MAKVDITEFQSSYMNPQAYSNVRADKKKPGASGVRRKEFFSILDELRGKNDELAAVQDLPVSEETVNLLMDEVRNTGDILKTRPLPEEIINYKTAVRDFMHYVVKNNYSLEHETGIPKFLKPGFKGQRGTPAANENMVYTKIQVIDRKLEDLAAMLLSSQMPQIKLVARIEEINGLLVDLLQ
jgi:uncharacterized protein YaaR (DUF327 family)